MSRGTRVVFPWNDLQGPHPGWETPIGSQTPARPLRIRPGDPVTGPDMGRPRGAAARAGPWRFRSGTPGVPRGAARSASHGPERPGSGPVRARSRAVRLDLAAFRVTPGIRIATPDTLDRSGSVNPGYTMSSGDDTPGPVRTGVTRKSLIHGLARRSQRLRLSRNQPAMGGGRRAAMGRHRKINFANPGSKSMGWPLWVLAFGAYPTSRAPATPLSPTSESRTLRSTARDA